MKNGKGIKDCFGMQAESMLDGQLPEACLECELFDSCHKVTVAAALQGIAIDLSLLVQNGLNQGWLKSFTQLDQESHLQGLLKSEGKPRKYDA